MGREHTRVPLHTQSMIGNMSAQEGGAAFEAAAGGEGERASVVSSEIVCEEDGESNLKYDQDPYGDGPMNLTATECEFIRVMRAERVGEMLTSKSVRLIHKFSIAFPAHIVATVMCVWFLIAFLIVGMISQHSSDRLTGIEKRIVMMETMVENRTLF